MDIEVGDVFWSIARDDESNYRSPNVGTRTPFPVMVVEVGSNVKVSNFTGGEPDRDTNATTTFGPTEDPSDYLFESEKHAWIEYASRLYSKAERRRKQAEGLDRLADNIRQGLADELAPEYLKLLEMGSDREHVDEVREADLERIENGEREEQRPINIFPHEFRDTDE